MNKSSPAHGSRATESYLSGPWGIVSNLLLYAGMPYITSPTFTPFQVVNPSGDRQPNTTMQYDQNSMLYSMDPKSASWELLLKSRSWSEELKRMRSSLPSVIRQNSVCLSTAVIFLAVFFFKISPNHHYLVVLTLSYAQFLSLLGLLSLNKFQYVNMFLKL